MVYKYIKFLYNFGDIQILSQKYSFKNIMYRYIVPNITLQSNYHFFLMDYAVDKWSSKKHTINDPMAGPISRFAQHRGIHRSSVLACL